MGGSLSCRAVPKVDVSFATKCSLVNQLCRTVQLNYVVSEASFNIDCSVDKHGSHSYKETNLCFQMGIQLKMKGTSQGYDVSVGILLNGNV